MRDKRDGRHKRDALAGCGCRQPPRSPRLLGVGRPEQMFAPALRIWTLGGETLEDGAGFAAPGFAAGAWPLATLTVRGAGAALGR